MSNPTSGRLTYILSTIFFVTATLSPVQVHGQQGDDLEAIRANMPVVVLNQLVYDSGDDVKGLVRFIDPADITNAMPALIYVTDSSKDIELVELVATDDPLVFETSAAVTILDDAANAVTNDNVLSLGPGEVFTALLTYKLSDRTSKPGDRAFSGDWGVLLDPHGGAPVEVQTNVTLTADELEPPPGLPEIGTLFVEGDVGPVQVASKELLFLPQSEAQLNEFILRTGGTIVGYEGKMGPLTNPNSLPKPGEAWLRVKLEGDPSKIDQLPQLRALAGEQLTLSASNDEVLALVATAMELWCEGYLVSLHPRMQLHGDLNWPDAQIESQRVDSFGNIGEDISPNSLRDVNFGIRKAWAFMAMFDFDRARVPVGVIDSGFAPNPDFKTGEPLYAEANLATGATGIGSARVPQEVGNSFFGEKSWHGNGTVTTISGVGGNRFGTAGTGAQVAVPKLYHMGLADFALGFGTAIRRAVDDGCSVINISAGYPCRVLSVLGNDNICSPEGRAAFLFKLGTVVRAAALAACAATPLLDAFLPGLGAATCGGTLAAAEAAALGIFSAMFLGETRTPVERAVEYATSRGVPVVASAGNRLTDDALGALGPFVNNGNTNIDDWRIIPAVIPEVIAVGACVDGGWDLWKGNSLNFYANIHFWGDSVDIWAPSSSWYWAPEQGDVDPATIPVSDHIRRDFGGTSCSAPFITGIIANLMAINPALDRRFAPPETWTNLPGQIRDLLVNTAHQAGDATAPDSADDRILFTGNDTDGYVQIDEPQELLDQLQRRRNYVNAWAAVQQAAAAVGVVDYQGLGYETDLGMDDRLADVRAPDGVLEPVKTAPFYEKDEIAQNDRDFWFLQTPPIYALYQVRYQATFPLSEPREGLLMNGYPGVLVSSTGDEQTVAWESPQLWRRAHFPTSLSGRWSADMVYRLSATIMTNFLPPPDRFEYGYNSNQTLDEAATVSEWLSVPSRDRLEVAAFELCVSNLNFHDESDVDVFLVEFPDPPIQVPFSCGPLVPWVTIQIEPPNSTVRISVFSRSGGGDTLLDRGTGADVVRLDCRDYLGRFPLYVQLESSTDSFAAYDLKVRWSIPDGEAGERLDRIREAHAGPRQIPDYEVFFRPEIPWLRASPGLLPEFLVNPNPAFTQELGPNGQFLASRLFMVEVPQDGALNTTFAAVIGQEQSLRMELVSLFEQTLGMTATPDLLIEDPMQSVQTLNVQQLQQQPGLTQTLWLDFPNLEAGTYILRLSGHRPGDPISLYLSQNLVPPGTPSVESILLQQGQASATPLGLPVEFTDSAVFALTGSTPSVDPGRLRIRQGTELEFFAETNTGYQVEVQNPDGIWEPFGHPLLGTSSPMTVVAPRPHPGAQYRITKLGESQPLQPSQAGPAYHLLFQSFNQTPYTLTGSATLAPGSFAPFNGSQFFTGTGELLEWYYAPSELPDKLFFLRVEETDGDGSP